MFGVAFGVALGLCQLVGITSNGPLLAISSAPSVAVDLAYRSRRPARRWFHPNSGGALFFIPVWIFGTIFLILGLLASI